MEIKIKLSREEVQGLLLDHYTKHYPIQEGYEAAVTMDRYGYGDATIDIFEKPKPEPPAVQPPGSPAPEPPAPEPLAPETPAEESF